MTGCDHETSEAVAQAAQWLRFTPERPSPIVPFLGRRFGLNPKQACEAIAEFRKAA